MGGRRLLGIRIREKQNLEKDVFLNCESKLHFSLQNDAPYNSAKS